MPITYQLAGTFVEACNCKVICPCWVDDSPDEDHCAGLFAWRFDHGSTIGDAVTGVRDIGGSCVVSVSVHGDNGRRGGESQSAIYVSDSLDQATADLLVRAFAGATDGSDPLASLASVTGRVVDAGRARVEVVPDAGGWRISVVQDGSDLVRAQTTPARFDSRPSALRLSDTALSAELGMAAGQRVTAHRAAELTVDVAALPGPPVAVYGRSAMSGRFRYDHPGSTRDADHGQ